jgi:hypothetical protein
MFKKCQNLYKKALDVFAKSERSFLINLLHSKIIETSGKLKTLVGKQRNEEFSILEIKTIELMRELHDESQITKDSDKTPNTSTRFSIKSNIGYVLLSIILIIAIFFLLCFDLTLYKNTVKMINSKFIGGLELLKIQRKTIVLVSQAIGSHTKISDYGKLSDLQISLKNFDLTPILEMDLLGYTNLFNTFNADDHGYNLCTVDFMEEIVMILDLCQEINPSVTLKSSYDISNQLSNFKKNHENGKKEDVIVEPTAPYVDTSKISELYYVNTPVLIKIVNDNLSLILSLLSEDKMTIENLEASSYEPIVNILKTYNHMSYITDATHHFTV